MQNMFKQYAGIKIKATTLLGLIIVIFTVSIYQLTKINEDALLSVYFLDWIHFLVLCLDALLSVYFLDWIYFLILCLFIITDILSLKASRITKEIILIGFLSRIFLLLWSIYGIKGAFYSFLNSGDSIGFFKASLNYFHGDFSFKYTTYPYVINFIFQIFGPYRLMVQMINILFWYWGLKIIVAASGNMLFGRIRQYSVAFYCLLPYQMLLTSAILRESMLTASIMLSIRMILNWQDTGKKKNIFKAILFALPSIILHTGHITIWITIFLVYEFWSPQKQKWKKLSWKTLLLLFMIIFSVPIYENVIKFFPGYLPSTLSLQTITDKTYESARADYVNDSMVAANMLQFFYYTLYRMFYFWASPTPRFWTSILDVIGFVFDTLPWFFFMLAYYRQIKEGLQMNQGGGTAIILFLAFTFVYAWGTKNAGTAMRHRGELVGPMVMLMMYGMKKHRI